jgi:hypothetical protein
MKLVAAGATAITACLVCASAASGAWHQPVGGPFPLNEDPNRNSDDASLTSVDGVPYVAWTEFDGTNYEARVARLDSAGTAWEKVADLASPINESTARNADHPSLTAIGGVPYVAWSESDGAFNQIRVARLNPAGTAWEKVADSASPINESSTRNAVDASLASISGVSYVAWREYDGTNYELRVARLNGAGTAWEKVADSASPINESPTRDAAAPSLTGVGGVPYVAWSEFDGANTEIRVARLNGAGTAWQKVADSPSPINESPTRNAVEPSLTSIGATPYVAWGESDAAHEQIRVARLSAAGTAWEKVADSPSPINESATEDASEPSLTSIAGVPYVAWTEHQGTAYEVRVARPNASGTAWEKVAGSDSPINESTARNATSPSLAAIAGVPYVAWDEDDGTNYHARVSRLEPEFVSQSVAPVSTTAELSATWHTYGIAFPVGFEYGVTLESSTTPEPATVGADTATVTQQVPGLTPSTAYAYRPFATLGVPEPRLLGGTAAFATTAPPDTTITKEPKDKVDGSKATYKFTSSAPDSSFLCKFDQAKFKPCSSPHKLKHLDDGKHKFSVEAVDAAGIVDPTPAKDKFKIL